MASTKTHVSPFVDNLWRLVCDVPEEVGEWSESGEEYVVKQRYEFQNFALSYFTCNWKTFVRQLHFYGFAKTDSRGVTWSFSHPSFRRGRPDLLHGVKRKTLGKGKVNVNVSVSSHSKEDDLGRLKAEFNAYKSTAESVLEDTKQSLMTEIMALKRELSLVRRSVEKSPALLQDEQPLKRRRRWETSNEVVSVVEEGKEADDTDFLGEVDYQGIDEVLDQFGQDMMVPARLDPSIDQDLPEMWLVMDSKVNVGARFFASFLNSFVAAARSWYQSQAEPVFSKTIPQDYPLLKLQRILNPSASKILGSSLSTDELAHELIIRMGASENSCVLQKGITVFEYSLDGERRQLDACDFATFLSNIALGVQKLVNKEIKEIRGQPCPLFDRIRPLLAPFTQKAVLLSQELYRRNIVDKPTALRLWHCKCKCWT